MNLRSKALPLVFVFVLFTVVFVFAWLFYKASNIDFRVLLIANGLFFLTSLLVFRMQLKAMGNSNPNRFIRSVMLGMLLKMAVCIAAVMAYVFGSGQNFNKPAVYFSMVIYLIYLVAEVSQVMKLNKEKMPKSEAPLLQLQSYLPEGSFEEVLQYLQQYKVQLTITRQRQSILGDYRHAHGGKAHRISVNGNLNSYAFLITLLHELAHLFTYEKFGHRVMAHGAEWKNEYSKILAKFLLKKIFPADIEKTLLHTLQNPSGSSCGDEKLLRVLHHYDQKKEGIHLVEQLTEGALFSIKGGRVFKKGEKVRKRYKCEEVKTGKLYLFSPVYEVFIV